MGYDLPAAIGACVARKKKSVVLVTGDGSIQMNIQELQTVKHNKLPLKIFVLNNDGYLAIRTTQDTYFDGRYFASSEKGGVSCPDICAIGKAYGIKTMRIRNETKLQAKINDIMAFDGPVICEIMMDPRQTLYPKLASEVKPDGRLVSKPLEDMFPFLSREEFARHMIIDPQQE
jgi:acetolactate synthase-1/2/3 large subunit